jgi:hypothetical protein
VKRLSTLMVMAGRILVLGAPFLVGRIEVPLYRSPSRPHSTRHTLNFVSRLRVDRCKGAASWIVENGMRLQPRCHSDINLSQPGMQVEIRSHIARCLRDYPNSGEGVITPRRLSRKPHQADPCRGAAGCMTRYLAQHQKPFHIRDAPPER